MTSKIMPGTEIGRFQLVERIGHGGMGIVYRGFDPLLNRPAAIKLLAPHLGSDKDALARFHREAALVASLKHSNIATVYEFGESQGRPYIAMEWIAGRTLKEVLIDEGELSEERSLYLFDQLANALDYAHGRGVIHRDLKPANILVGADDLVTIVDFGVAWLDDSQSLTQTGSIVGTPLYMSPEQIQGKPLDGRSDQYSLAVILYEMLCGKTPFANPATLALFHQQIFAPAPPVTEVNPHVSLGVEHALMIALNKAPEERFHSAAQFSRALHAGPPPPERKIWPIMTAALIAGLLLGLASIVVFADGVSALREMLPIPSSTIPTEAPPEGSSWIQPGGGANQRFIYDDTVYPLESSARWQYATESDRGFGPIGDQSRIVYAEGSSLVALDWATGEEAWRTNLGAKITAAPVIGTDENDSSNVFAPTEDGLVYAFSLEDGGLSWRSNVDETDPLQTRSLTIAHNNLLYVTTLDGRLVTLNAETGALELNFTLEEDESIRFASSVTRLGVFVASEGGQLYAFNQGQPDPQWVTDLADVPSTAPIVANDLGLAFVATVNGRVKALSLLNGDIVWENNVFDNVSGISAENNHLIAVTRNGKISAFNAENGEPLWEQIIEREVFVPPLSVGSQVMIVARDGNIFYFDSEGGEQDRSQTIVLDEQIEHSPAPLGGWLYLRTANAVYAFAPD